MSPGSPLDFRWRLWAQSFATSLVPRPLTSGWADSVLTCSTRWLSGYAWLAERKGEAGQRRLSPSVCAGHWAGPHSPPAGLLARGALGCSLGCTQGLVFLLRSLPLLLFPLDQLHPLQVPLAQFLLISSQVLGLTCGEFFFDKLGGQRQKAFSLNPAQLLQFRLRGLLETKGQKLR